MVNLSHHAVSRSASAVSKTAHAELAISSMDLPGPESRARPFASLDSLSIAMTGKPIWPTTLPDTGNAARPKC
ncbi:hypothetical protein, partial [Mesorhizobium sp. M7A.F.Ca.MR.176.00.0.0]|uniref:hypothetical protein n=1 Tax=Mesorhizobium sp. M7A.F.Ca.MR.176.00.0.0 TaxID=2496776 RepID=UPI0019D42D1E